MPSTMFFSSFYFLNSKRKEFDSIKWYLNIICIRLWILKNFNWNKNRTINNWRCSLKTIFTETSKKIRNVFLQAVVSKNLTRNLNMIVPGKLGFRIFFRIQEFNFDRAFLQIVSSS